MQKIFIFFILFYQYQNGVTLYTPIDYMVDKLVDFVIDVADTVIQLKDRLGNLFVAQHVRQPVQPLPALPSMPSTSLCSHRNSPCSKFNKGSNVLSTTSSTITSDSTEKINDSNEWIESPSETARREAMEDQVFKTNGNIVPNFTKIIFGNNKNSGQENTVVNVTVTLSPMPELANNVTYKYVSVAAFAVNSSITKNFVPITGAYVNENRNFIPTDDGKNKNISQEKMDVNVTVTIDPMPKLANNVTDNYVPIMAFAVNASIIKNFVPITVSSINRTKNFIPMQGLTVNLTDDFVSIPKLDERHGNSLELHYVQTKDGYLLTLHRIKSKNGTINKNAKAVLLHHGLLGSSDDWILLGPNKSLPYLLSNAGYDVWLSNARGNYHSRDHVTFKENSQEFWNFSWHEIGIYDLPATIDYIRKLKNNTLLSFVGHSMGASALLVLMSTLPEYNNHLDIGILLAPLAFMGNIQGPLKSLSAPEFEIILQALGENGEFLPSREVPIFLREMYCDKLGAFCNNSLFFLSGGLLQCNMTNSSGFIDRVLKQVPSGGSLKTILHYSQLVRNQKFHKFDNASLDYPLMKMTLPIAVISSEDDWLATTPDVNKLLNNILNLVEHDIIRDKNISHTEMVWGSTSDKYVHNKIIDLLNGPSKSNMLK